MKSPRRMTVACCSSAMISRRPMWKAFCRLSDSLKPFGFHNGQQLERWPARPLRAALPLADQLWLHVEIMREHTLADARPFADGNDFLRRQRLDRRETGGVERPHGGLVHQTD